MRAILSFCLVSLVRQPGAPNFNDSPLAAIGFLLQQTGAGIQGRETPLEKLRKQNNLQCEITFRTDARQIIVSYDVFGDRRVCNQLLQEKSR